MSKILEFPTPNEYLWFIVESGRRTSLLIQALNAAFDQGQLTLEMFYGLLEQGGIDIYRDFTDKDRAIIAFHLREYYNLPAHFEF